MYESYVYLALLLTGLVLGSFVGATVWRLRARQLIADKAEGYPVDKGELSRLKKISSTKVKTDRSVCLECGHELKWYDLVPLISWLRLGGRCRYCRRPIGWLEPAVELGLAAFFVLSFAVWPVEISSFLEVMQFGLWLLSGVGLTVLFIYDAKWFLLPNTIMWPVIGIATAYAGLVVLQAPDTTSQLASTVGAILILSGLYLLLYMYSRWRNGEGGTWVGFGDVKLGLALALLLSSWQLAFLALFLANLIGCILVLPGLASGRLNRGAHVPFGPMLIAGFAIAGLLGENILQAYFSLIV